MTPEQKEFILARKDALKDLDQVYNQIDQACVAITDRIQKVAHKAMPYLTRDEKVLMQKRFNWITSYLRHFKLGDDCLHLVKEMEVLVEKDPYDQWSRADEGY